MLGSRHSLVYWWEEIAEQRSLYLCVRSQTQKARGMIEHDSFRYLYKIVRSNLKKAIRESKKRCALELFRFSW